MKFSILALLAATGYVALLIASFQQPLSLWRYAVMAGWLAIMAYVFMLAVSPMNRFQAMFGRVTVGGVATYLLLTIMTWPVANTARLGVLPHELLIEYWNSSSLNPLTPQSGLQFTTAYGPTMYPQPYAPPAVAYTYSVPGTPSAAASGYYAPAPMPTVAIGYATPAYNAKTMEAVAAMNCAVLFGFLGGGLAVMRSRRVERAQAKEKRLATINPLQEAEVSADGNY